MRLAVVGGGISGLAAAWEAAADPGSSVVVFEPGRLGGKLQTSSVAGVPVDEGPDAFLVRTAEATQLCEEVGLGDLVPPAAGHTLLWGGRRLRPLPDGLVLGVPGRLGPIARSGLLSPLGMARAALDLVLPRRPFPPDVSAGRLVRGRFGDEVADRLVEPLLGGIHAAPLDELSCAVVAPQLLSAARSSRSLLLGLRRQAAAAGTPSGPVFLAPKGGMARLVTSLVDGLRSRGVTFRDHTVTAVETVDATVRVLADGGSAEDFDGAVLAVPAPVAASLLGPSAPAGLAGIPFSSVAVLSVAVPASQWSPPPGFNGFLVPRSEGRLTTAGSFFTSKWPSGRGGHHHILRLSAGRFDDDRVERLDDARLSQLLVTEMGDALGVAVEPSETRLSRWPASFPLYRVGHGETVERIERELTALAPAVALAGSSYRGAGIPACIRSGREAVGRLRRTLVR